jgi:hypothetical protein
VLIVRLYDASFVILKCFMKAVTAILFTVLYTVFSCFALTGFAALACSDNTCKDTAFVNNQSSEINTDNSHDGCTHKPAVTAHVIQKQTNNLGSDGSKCWLLSKRVLHKFISSNPEASNSNELYSKTIVKTSCHLFIKHCVLLI